MNPPSSRARRLIGRGVTASALLFSVLSWISDPLVLLPPKPESSRDAAPAPRPSPHFTTLDPSALVEDWTFASMESAPPLSFDPAFHPKP